MPHRLKLQERLILARNTVPVWEKLKEVHESNKKTIGYKGYLKSPSVEFIVMMIESTKDDDSVYVLQTKIGRETIEDRYVYDALEEEKYKGQEVRPIDQKIKELYYHAKKHSK